MSLTDPGVLAVLPMLRCDRCDGDRPHVAASRWWRRCLACNRLRRADRGSADARLVLVLALIAGALWLCYLAPILAALVFLPAAVSAAVLLVVVWRAERREAAQRDRAVVRDLVEFRRDRDALRLPPLSPEAMERLRRGEGSL